MESPERAEGIHEPRVFGLQFSEIERWDVLSNWLLRGITTGWPLVALGELVSLRSVVVGEAASTSNSVRLVDRVSFGGEIFAGTRQATKMRQFLALPGDVVVSKIRARQGSVGLVEAAMGPVSVTIHYRVLTPLHERADARYVWIALRGSHCRAQFLAATGGAMKGEISESSLLDVRLPLPPLEVQHRIVDAWKGGVAVAKALEESVAQLESELTSGFLFDLGLDAPEDAAVLTSFAMRWSEIERWSASANQAALAAVDLVAGKYPTVSLGEIEKLVQYGTSEKANTDGTGLAVLRMNNIVNGALDLTELKHVALPEAEARRLLLQDGDILFNRTNSKELVGKCAVFHSAGTFVFASYLIRIRVDRERADPDFVACALNSPVGRPQIDALSRQIIGQANINSAELRSLRVPLPPLNVQRAIMRRVDGRRAEIVRQRAAAASAAKRVEAEVEEMILGQREPGAAVSG